MEYKVGDKVIVIDGEKSYVVEITNRYKLYANGYAYDGIRLFDKANIDFLERNIDCKIEAGPCTCGPKGEEGVKKEESYNYQMVNKSICVGCNHNDNGICNSKKVCLNGSAYEMIKQYVECDKCKNGVEYEPREWECLINEGKTNCDKFESKEVEEKKYLKTWEAIKALEEGKKITKKGLLGTKYISKEKHWFSNDNGDVMLFPYFDDEWEIYEEPKKEIPKEFEGLKYILGSINNMDCGEKDCDKCPLGVEKCDMLDEIFFDMKEKYNF